MRGWYDVAHLILATANNRGGSIPFFVGLILWAGPVLILTIIMTRAQRRYLQHYRIRYGIHLPLSGEAKWQQGMELINILLKTAPRKIRAYSESQRDVGLERERRAIRRLGLLIVIWVLIGWIIPFGLGVLSSS